MQEAYFSTNKPVRATEKQLVEAPEIEQMASTLQQTHALDFGPAEIGFILVYPHLSKKQAAKVIKASKEVKHYSGNDYLIEISGELWDMLDDQTRQAFLHQQLMRLNPVFNPKSQDWSFRTRPDEYRTFYKLDELYGSNWYKAVQSTQSSLYDLTPSDEVEVKL